MDENTNDTLSLLCFLFLSCFFNQKQIILYNSFTWSSPTMTIPASWFLIQILHIYKKFFFFFLFQQQQCKRLIFLFGAIEFAEKVKSLICGSINDSTLSLSPELIPLSISQQTASHVEQVIVKINQVLIDRPITRQK